MFQFNWPKKAEHILSILPEGIDILKYFHTKGHCFVEKDSFRVQHPFWYVDNTIHLNDIDMCDAFFMWIHMTLLSFNEIQKYSTPQVLLTLHEWTQQFRSSVLNQPQNRMEFNSVILSFLLLGSLLTFRYAHYITL